MLFFDWEMLLKRRRLRVVGAMVVVFAVLLLRQALHGQAAYVATESTRRDARPIRLRGPLRWLAFRAINGALHLIDGRTDRQLRRTQAD